MHDDATVRSFRSYPPSGRLTTAMTAAKALPATEAGGQAWNADPECGHSWIALDSPPMSTDSMLPCLLSCVSSAIMLADMNQYA